MVAKLTQSFYFLTAVPTSSSIFSASYFAFKLPELFRYLPGSTLQNAFFGVVSSTTKFLLLVQLQLKLSLPNSLFSLYKQI